MHPVRLPASPSPHPVRQDLNVLKQPSLTLTESLHAPDLTIPPHIHSTASICLTLTGEACEYIERKRFVVHPGCAIVRGPEVKHANTYGPLPHRGFMIELDNKWLGTCSHFSSVFDGYRLYVGGRVPALALRIYHESRIKDGVAPVIVEGLVLEMLVMRLAGWSKHQCARRAGSPKHEIYCTNGSTTRSTSMRSHA